MGKSVEIEIWVWYGWCPKSNKKRYCSNVWKGVVQASSHLKEGLAWNIGDGKCVSFWKDKWIPNFGSLENYASGTLSAEELNKNVANYTSNRGDWNWHMLNNLLLEYICKWMATIIPPHPHSGKNVVRWPLLKDGEFSVKSAYDSLMEGQNEPDREETIWKKIWNWKGLESYKTFMWLSIKRDFSQTLEGWHCSFQVMILVQYAKKQPKSVLHVLRDCQAASNVWHRLAHPRH